MIQIIPCDLLEIVSKSGSLSFDHNEITEVLTFLSLYLTVAFFPHSIGVLRFDYLFQGKRVVIYY